MDDSGGSRDRWGDRWDPTRRDVLRATGVGVVGESVLSGIATPVSGQSSDEEWPQFSYDAANTGHAPENSRPHSFYTLRLD
jgi:hypothetical protein